MDRFKVGVIAGLVMLGLSVVGLWLKQNKLESQCLTAKASLVPSPSSVNTSPSSSLVPSPSPSPIPSPSPSSVFTPAATVQWQPQNIYLGSASTVKTDWKNSPGFKLHSGTNTYVIELKSTTGEQANLSGARLKLSL